MSRLQIRLPLLLAIVACALLVAGPAAAGRGDRVVMGNDVVIAEGEEVRGDIVVLWADARVDGTVHGDVVVVGGDLVLGPTARVDGDLAVAGGDLTRAGGAQVDGSLVGISDTGLDAEKLVGQVDPKAAASAHSGPQNMLELRRSDGSDGDGEGAGFVTKLGTSLLLSSFLMVLGLLFMSIWPERSRNLRRTLEASPWASLTMGMLVSAGLGLVALLLTITVVGVLALPLLATAALAVWLVGITGLLEAIGDRLPMPERLRSRGWDFIAGIGIFAVLAVMWSMGGGLAGLAVLATLVLGFMAVGAAVLSGLGRSPYGKV
jgi:hypothetical protein